MNFSQFTPEQIQAAREKYANDFIAWANLKFTHEDYAVLRENYSPQEVNQMVQDDIKWAEEVRAGRRDGNFTVRQKLYYILTGECIALLPKVK